MGRMTQLATLVLVAALLGQPLAAASFCGMMMPAGPDCPGHCPPADNSHTQAQPQTPACCEITSSEPSPTAALLTASQPGPVAVAEIAPDPVAVIAADSHVSTSPPLPAHSASSLSVLFCTFLI